MNAASMLKRLGDALYSFLVEQHCCFAGGMSFEFC